jgi:cytochrome c
MAMATAAALLGLVSACGQTETKTETAPAPSATPEASAPAAPPTAPAAKMVMTEVKDAAGATMQGDVTNGERVYRQCMSCHSMKPGENRVGPSLHGIIGRKAGTVEGFRYSDANKNSGIDWTEQKMFEYLENPRAKMPGTIMAFVGIKDVQDRVDLIAYIQENSK